jgi:hypothetical protein
MNDQLSEECSALALYGVDQSADALAAFYFAVISWFEELGWPPDKLGVRGPGHSGRPVSFKSAHQKLVSRGFSGVADVSIFSLLPEYRIPVDDYVLTAVYSAKDSVACIVSRLSIAQLSESSMLPLVKRTVPYTKPEYGIGYMRERRLGPMMYALGVCQGLGKKGYGIELSRSEEEEADSISRWADAMDARVWNAGFLRDVYPWNLLTKPQLMKKVGAIPLEQWIRRNTRRGTLTSLDNNIVLWEIPKSNIRPVRYELQRAGAIFDWRVHLDDV